MLSFAHFSGKGGWIPRIKAHWPGVAIATVIALASSFVSMSYGGPQLLYALFFGLSVHFLSENEACRLGINFCSRTLLRVGVALLGAKITFAQIMSIGMVPIFLTMLSIAATITLGVYLSRFLKRPLTEGLLTSGSVAICGASAAMAIAAVLPQNKENEKFTLLTIVGVTSLSTIAMIVYPLLVKVLHLDSTAAGIFIGGTIHDVAQVVGAGYLISSHTGDIAVIVKLIRVACLVPVVLGLSVFFKFNQAKTNGSPETASTQSTSQSFIPVFLLGFIFLMIMKSIGFIPKVAADQLNLIARACLVTAIAALGVKTSFQSLASLGWTPVFMLVAETLWIACFVLGAQWLSHLHWLSF